MCRYSFIPRIRLWGVEGGRRVVWVWISQTHYYQQIYIYGHTYHPLASYLGHSLNIISPTNGLGMRLIIYTDEMGSCMYLWYLLLHVNVHVTASLQVTPARFCH